MGLTTERQLLVIVWFAIIFASTALKYCVERRTDCDGPDNECSSTVPCHHGECDVTRQLCLCQGCWAGKNCNQYVDEHPPIFLNANEYITVSTDNSGVLFTATAFDADRVQTCRSDEVDSGSCPCGKIRYDLIAGYDEKHFEFDVDTGSVSTRSALDSGVEYILMIGASSTGRSTNGTSSTLMSHHEVSRRDAATLEVRIQVRSTSAKVVAEDKTFHRRIKRAAGTTGFSNQTVLTLDQVDPIPDITQAAIGDGKKFMMQILVPIGVSMDINVEIFTVDPASSQTAFAVCSMSMQTGAQLQPTSIGAVQPELYPSLNYPQFNDRILLDFDVVETTDNSSPDSDRKISVNFTAFLLNNSPYVVDGGSYSVVAGVAYDDDYHIWIAQAQFTAVIKSSSDNAFYPSDVRLEGADTIHVAGYEEYTIKVYSTNPLASYHVNVFAVNAPPDSYSAGPIILESVAKNYACIGDDLLAYAFELVPSDTGNTAKTSTLKTREVINCDDTGRNSSDSDDNEMLFKFLIAIPEDDDLFGSVIPLTATVMIDTNVIWANILNITILPKDYANEGNPTMSGRNATVSGPLLGTVTFQVDITLPEKTYAGVALEVLAPRDSVDPAALSLCGYTTSRGINIPYSLMNAEPELTSRSETGALNDKMLVPIGRIWNTDMVKGNSSASTLTVTMFMRIEDASADGKEVRMRLIKSEGSWEYATATVTVEINDDTLPEAVTDTDIQMIDIFNQSTVAIEGDAAIQFEMSFNAEMLVNSMSLEVMSAFDNETIIARVCRAEMTFVGIDIPCINKRNINKNVDYRIRNPDGDVFDVATMNLGSICISAAINKSDDDKLITIFAVELLDQPAATDGALYTLYGGVKMGNEMIWTGATTYTVQTTPTAIFNEGQLPSVTGFLSPNTPAIPGSTVLVLIRLKIPPMSRAAYVLTMSTQPGVRLGICMVTLIHVGHNFPCVDPDPQPGNVSRAATTRIEYDQKDDSMGDSIYSKAILDFGPISNFGSTPYNTRPEDDDNSITVAIAVKLDGSVTSGDTLALAYTAAYTSQTDITGSVDILINSTALPPFTKPNMTYEVFNETTSTSIDVKLTNILIFKFQVPDGTYSPVTVKFQNPDAAAKGFGFCSASVTKVGRNIPCFNSLSITAKLDDTSTGNCAATLIVDLGVICYTHLSQDPDEDWVTIEVGMNIIDPTLSGTVIPKATLIAGTSAYDADPLTLIVDNAPIMSSIKNLTLTPLINASIPIFVGVRTWIDLNVTIPEGSLFAMKMTAVGASSNDRAVITFTGIRVTAAGINVACIRNSTEDNSKLLTSDAISTTQKDLASVDFGYILNTGFTYRRGYRQSFDDQVTISVEVIMTDHPMADDEAEFPIQFTVEAEADIYTAQQMLIVNRNGTEKPEIDVIAQVIDSKLLRPLDTVNMRLLLSHKRTSSAESTDADVHLYLPSFMSFTASSAVANVTLVESLDNFPILRLTTPFLFDDIYEINFTLTVDPQNKRGFDASTIHAVSLGRVMAHVRQRTVDGTQYPKMATDYLFAANMFSVSYRITGEPCKEPLGMEDKTIRDCQLSASTATDETHGPSNARFNGASGIVWQPALRNNGHLDYLQVDFGNRTRVAQIGIQKDSCCRAPTAISIQYSDTGQRWKDFETVPINVTYIANTATLILDEPFETRMVRLILTTIDELENKDTKYVGIRVEFYGCSVSSVNGENNPLADICEKTPKTIHSTDVAEENNAVFACDLKANTWDLNCFCSADGSKWTRLPSFINNIVGYDGSLGRTYATDARNTTLLVSDDCSKWLAATRKELEDAKASGRFKESSVVAGLAKDDPSMLKVIGKWKATYDGLYLEDKKRLGWSQ